MKTTSRRITGKTRATLFILGVLFTSFFNAQDKITLKSGEEISASITEITDEEIKYKRTDDPDGPIRVFYKHEVFLIKYANGSKELFANDVKPVSSQSNYYSGASASTSNHKNSSFDPDTSDFAKKKRKNFSGPRVGVTYLSEGTTASYLEGRGKSPFITQFGWQFEARLFTIEDGTAGIVEFIPMIGGVEQAMFLPSISFLLGLRGGTDKSWEFAMGPSMGIKYDHEGNLKSPFGLVLAFGTSFKKGNVWFPVNLAFTPSVGSVETVNIVDSSTGLVTGTEEQKFKTGWKLSLIVGFNSRRK